MVTDRNRLCVLNKYIISAVHYNPLFTVPNIDAKTNTWLTLKWIWENDMDKIWSVPRIRQSWIYYVYYMNLKPITYKIWCQSFLYIWLYTILYLCGQFTALSWWLNPFCLTSSVCGPSGHFNNSPAETSQWYLNQNKTTLMQKNNMKMSSSARLVHVASASIR